MKEHPILLRAPEVRAILEGRKTQTRRVVKPQPMRTESSACVYEGRPWWHYHNPRRRNPADFHWADGDTCTLDVSECPYGTPGDRLWVRETHALGYGFDGYMGLDAYVHYEADNSHYALVRDRKRLEQFRKFWSQRALVIDKKCPSIHMPRWASRITLGVEDVRVERLQDISEEDAVAEGTDCRSDLAWGGSSGDDMPRYAVEHGHRAHFHDLWDSINTKPGHTWVDNPWVWAITFRRIEG